MNIQTVLNDISFRPGWKFRLDDSGDIVVTARVQNAYGPGTATVRGYVMDPWRYRTERGLVKAIYDAISGILHHEASEWLRYKGHRPFNPHV